MRKSIRIFCNFLLSALALLVSSIFCISVEASTGQDIESSNQPFSQLMIRKVPPDKYYLRVFGSNQGVIKDLGEFPAANFPGDSGPNHLLAEFDNDEFKATLSLPEPPTGASQTKVTIFLETKHGPTYKYYEADLPLAPDLHEIASEPFPDTLESKKPSWIRRWLNKRILKEQKKNPRLEQIANELGLSPLYVNAVQVARTRGYEPMRWNITEFRIDLAKRTFTHFFDHQAQWSPDEVIMQTFTDKAKENFAIVLIAKKDSAIQSAIFIDSAHLGRPGEKSDKPTFSAYLYHDLKRCTGPCLNSSIMCFGSAAAALPLGHLPGASAAYLHCMINDTKCRDCAMQAMIQSIIDYACGATLEDPSKTQTSP